MSEPFPFPPNPANLPTPPFHDIPGIANLRDVGGYACRSLSPSSGPSSIRRNLVYRSADPSRVRTPDGLAKLQSLGIKKVFDLRSGPELRRVGKEWEGISGSKEVFVTRDSPSTCTSKSTTAQSNTDSGSTAQDHTNRTSTTGPEDSDLPPGAIERLWTPVFAEQDYSPEKIALRYREYAQSGPEGFVKAYTAILEAGGPAYAAILRHLAANDPQPCLVHCTAGKDRTGVLVGLLLALVGVEKGVVADEYALTDLGLENLKPVFMERLLRNEALRGNVDGVRNMSGSKRENMLGLLEKLDQDFGGAEGYLRTVVGLSAEEVEALKGNLVVAEKAVL